jgi:hypothetical protein
MATNPFFKYGQRSEQNLYENLVIEAIKMYGQDVYYLPREIVNEDKIFLDDVPSRFSSSYKLEMYIENADGFDGEGDIFTKFGIELRDQATFVVSRKRWKQMIGNNLDKRDFRPREGDIIYLPMSKSMFQIQKVETETPFYQLKDLPTFRLSTELFEYSDEDFDTEIEGIDDLELTDAYTYQVTLDSDGTGTNSSTGFVIGETVTQTFDNYSMKGELTRWSDSDLVMNIVHSGATDGKFHTWTTGRLVVGDTSEAKASPTLVTELQNIQKDAQNKIFDDFESDFLDFSESNPFGDIS